eukprot:Plantae.Rhodophyta-Purpureofilum_apyrenoidigerum.ctg5275.p1 GENE.Plantae.Rhodophyta-Purpureofilum_apyrenoidigerum.ctg5275~~Plantae.Rhodophyta-Purpureofilum_apyrenoidigerum.ctg5275.p1  ORF type:complete len:420 (-),score=81.29 Plantae.Rhodophyta-Purpureofilum_apyrenoidigerum.ctg5275:218-1477(-)
MNVDELLSKAAGSPVHHTKPEAGTNGSLLFGNRRASIPCLQFERDGSFSRREISKGEIIEHARKTSNLPEPRAIVKYLATSKADSDDMERFTRELGLNGNEKYKQKVLRKYLKTALQPRDLRQVDPTFPQKPAIWVRQSALIASLEQVRSIIFHDLMYIFDPDNPVVKRCTLFIQETLYGGNIDENFLPFEFRALEGFLIFVTTTLEVDFGAVAHTVQRSLADPETVLTTRILEDMRLDKQKLSHFLSRAQAVHGVLTDLLEEDEDMANMYLTEKHRNPGVIRNSLDHEEAEMLLESYLQIMDDLTNKAKLLDHEIDDSEDVVAIHLDTLRNKLIMLQLLLSVVGLGFTVGGMIAGVFGMNLQIPLFESSKSKWWFLGVCLLIISIFFLVPAFIINWLRRRNLYASFHHTMPAEVHVYR